jgi:hypothetical protein
VPIHDWTKVEAGIFHHFLHEWLFTIKAALNQNLLSSGHYALAEHVPIGNPSNTPSDRVLRAAQARGIVPPARKNRIAVKNAEDDGTVQVIDIVSPGDKDGRRAWRAFLERNAGLLADGVHVLVVDLHPPSERSSVADLLDDKPLTIASYQAGSQHAHVEPVAVGEVLPDMPLFLVPGGHILVPLEKTYQEAWRGVPARWRKVIDPTSS